MSLDLAGVGCAPLCQEEESVLDKRLTSLRPLVRLYLGLWVNAVNYCTSCSQSSLPWSLSAQHFSGSSLASFQKVAKFRETDVPTWCWCRKRSLQILFYIMSLFLWWADLMCFASQPPFSFLLLQYTHLCCFVPSFLFSWLLVIS